MRKILVVIALACLCIPVGARADEPPVAAGFENPESAVWDAASSAWYVSSKGGYAMDLFAREGDGFISKLAPNGDVLATEWLTGLDSPYGLAISNGTLYAADIDRLDVIDVATAAVVRRIPLPGASGSLNDVAVDPATGDVYVSAHTAQKIYRVLDGEAPVVEVFASGAQLHSPNGLVVEDGVLYVATLGIDEVSPSTPAPGRIYRVGLDDPTRTLHAITGPLGVLDGLVKDGDRFIASDFVYGKLFVIAADGSVSEQQFPPSAADIGYDAARGVVALPVTGTNTVHFVTV